MPPAILVDAEKQTKPCAKCKNHLHVSCFTKEDKNISGYSSHCRECRSASRKDTYQKPENKLAASLRHRLRTYGLTPEQEEQIRMLQGNRCPGCRGHIKGGKKTHVDHDHATGKIRGILCEGCNFALGYAKDSPKALRNLANYLEFNAAMEVLYAAEPPKKRGRKSAPVKLPLFFTV